MTTDVGWIVDRLTEHGGDPAIVRDEHVTTYDDLLALLPNVSQLLDRHGVGAGDRVVLIGDFGTVTTALLLELMARRAVIIPMTPTPSRRRDVLFPICAAQWCIDAESASSVDQMSIEPLNATSSPNAAHELFAELGHRDVPGLLLFTSGSTGEPKAVLHDFSLLLEKFSSSGRPRYVLSDSRPPSGCSNCIAQSAASVPVTLGTPARVRHSASPAPLAAATAATPPSNTVRRFIRLPSVCAVPPDRRAESGRRHRA